MNAKYLILTGAGILALGSHAALAGDTNTLTVSASVTATCKFNSTTSSLAFGSLDPSSATNATAAGSTSYWCTKGTIASTAADNGANFSSPDRRMTNGSGEYIPYSLTLTGGTQTGAGKGTPLTLSLAGTVLNTSFINAAAGAYTDTVTLTITP